MTSHVAFLPEVNAILALVQYTEPATASHIPGPAFLAARKRLLTKRGQPTLFADLVVAWAHVRALGLSILAQQLYELALLGLSKSELDRALDAQTTFATAAKAVLGGGNPQGTAGLAAPSKGVGMRTKRNPS